MEAVIAGDSVTGVFILATRALASSVRHKNAAFTPLQVVSARFPVGDSRDERQRRSESEPKVGVRAYLGDRVWLNPQPQRGCVRPFAQCRMPV